MRVLILFVVLLIANSAQAASLIPAVAQGAAYIGSAIVEPAPPKPGLKPEDSRNGGDGIKTLRQPKQEDWDRWLRSKGYETGPRSEKSEVGG